MHEGKIKRAKDVKFLQIEKNSYDMVLVISKQGGGLLGKQKMPSEKVVEFRDAFGILEKDFKLSPRWLGKFKARYGIACHDLVVNLVILMLMALEFLKPNYNI